MKQVTIIMLLFISICCSCNKSDNNNTVVPSNTNVPIYGWRNCTMYGNNYGDNLATLSTSTEAYIIYHNVRYTVTTSDSIQSSTVVVNITSPEGIIYKGTMKLGSIQVLTVDNSFIPTVFESSRYQAL